MKYIIDIVGLFDSASLTISSTLGTIFFTGLTWALIECVKLILKKTLKDYDKWHKSWGFLIFFAAPFLLWLTVGWILTGSFVHGLGVGALLSVLSNYFYSIIKNIVELFKKDEKKNI